MTQSNEAPSENVLVTATAPMNILRPDPDESLEDALKREFEEEMTLSRMASFFEDASFEVEPMEEDA